MTVLHGITPWARPFLAPITIQLIFIIFYKVDPHTHTRLSPPFIHLIWERPAVEKLLALLSAERHSCGVRQFTGFSPFQTLWYKCRLFFSKRWARAPGQLPILTYIPTVKSLLGMCWRAPNGNNWKWTVSHLKTQAQVLLNSFRLTMLFRCKEVCVLQSFFLRILARYLLKKKRAALVTKSISWETELWSVLRHKYKNCLQLVTRLQTASCA